MRPRIAKSLCALALVLLAAPARAELPVEPAVVVREYPHDTGAYTEGLLIDHGRLYESTGQVGQSSVRVVELATGRVLRRVTIPPPFFGEGISPWRGQILGLTWRNGVGFRWNRATLKPIGRFTYAGEGWALTPMGADLVMSDGTPNLRIVDPADFRVKRVITVTAEGHPLGNLNELEYVGGEILANIWLTDRIARIDPATGHVLGLIDVSALHARAGSFGVDQVANGIAWDAARHRLYVTGKQWPVLFEIRPPGRR